MEFGDAFAATNDNDISLAATYHVGSQYDSVCRRRTCCRQSGDESELAKVLGGHLGAASAIVNSDVFLVILVVDVVEVKLLAHVHAADCRARDKTDVRNHLRRYFCLFQSLVESYHSHQSGASCNCVIADIHQLTHLFIAHLDLADRELLVLRFEIDKFAHATAIVQQGVQRFSLVVSNRRDDATTRYQNGIRHLFCSVFCDEICHHSHRLEDLLALCRVF